MKQILLFDRAMLVRMRIKEALSTSEVKVLEVESESEVFNTITKLKDSLDLIIMDVVLDSSDGFEVVRRIKEMQHNLPVVILTASNKRGDFIKGIQAGASDYILKPFEDEFFKARIFSVMNSASERKRGNVVQREHEAFNPKANREALRESAKEAAKETKVPEAPMETSASAASAKSVHEPVEEQASFEELLKSEKYKAKKGKYPLSVFALIFEEKDGANVSLSEKHYSDIRAQLWESDEFVHLGPRSFYGILPFCHEEGFERFKEKMKVYLNEEAEEKEFYHEHLWHVVGLTLSSHEYEDLDTDQIFELLKIEVGRELKAKKS